MESYNAARQIAGKLSRSKARDVVIIDISEKSSFADYFINATAGSERQLGALKEDAENEAYKLDLMPKGVEGRVGTGWILMDCGDVIVNLFTEETRKKYSLDKIWSDCTTEIIEE